MASTVTLFQMLPWLGGMNTTDDPSMIPSNELVVCDNNVFATRGSKKKREGNNHDWDDAANASVSIIGLHDFWFGTSRAQRIVSVGSNGAVYSYNGGPRTTLTDNGTAWAGTLESASLLSYGNKCFIAVNGSANKVKYWDGTNPLEDIKNINGAGVDVTASYAPPKASILREHQGRIWCNDKSNPDLLHYCTTGNPSQWSGVGDSGAFPIGSGDGDPEGITAIWSFKGDLFVAKRTKLYRLVGASPEEMRIIKVSDGIGCVSHNSVAFVDQDDVLFVSERGVHSLATTANYGDFEAAYVSKSIQATFNDDFQKTRLKFTWGAYLSSINSVAFTFANETVNNEDVVTSKALYGNSTPVTSDMNNEVWLYNIPGKLWYRWPALSCQALIAANDSDKRRFYFGTHVGRVSKSFVGTNYDTTTAGGTTAVKWRVTTGQIFVDNSPYSVKAFKRFVLFYRPRGSHNVTVTFRVDNQALDPVNAMSFASANSGTPLGVGFVLGSTPLGSETIMGPYTRMIDGVGRGCKITMEQSGTDEEIEIQGFGLEWEMSGTSPDVNLPE
jgi:hypothetical protein